MFFKTRLLGRGFHILIKNVSFSSPTDVGSHNPPPSGLNVLTSTRSLLQSMWDPPPIHPLQSPTSLLAQTRMLERGFHTLIRNVSFSSPTNVGSHNPHPFRAQRLRWHSFTSPTSVSIPIHPLRGQCLLRRGFHTLIRICFVLGGKINRFLFLKQLKLQEYSLNQQRNTHTFTS